MGFDSALEMYRALGMPFWIARAEQARPRGGPNPARRSPGHAPGG
jgi:hypothetical protein